MAEIHHFLKTFKIMIIKDEFTYIDSYLYKNILLKILDDIIYYYNLNEIEKYNDEFMKNYTHNEKLILNILIDLFKSKGEVKNLNFNNSNDIEHIANYLNKISLTINRKNSIENQNSILPVTSTSDLTTLIKTKNTKLF